MDLSMFTVAKHCTDPINCSVSFLNSALALRTTNPIGQLIINTIRLIGTELMQV